ncbi:hypothetical protein ACO0LO_10485 [Undibacterium sp. TJN25]|uniref:hypothetical protein n=1 Tax=Undibacterium sp. TJN25 TaxID=3413056 RepID=UPI003BF14BB7
MSGHRQAAVALHGLSRQDKDWILNELPSGDRELLQQYLDELEELGFSNEDASGYDFAEQLAFTAPKGALSAIEHLRTASSMQMFQILEGEPASLIGRVLAIEGWNWADACVGMFSSVRQEQIRLAKSQRSEIPLAQKDFLLNTLGARLAALAPERQQADLGAGEPSPVVSVRQALSRIRHTVSRWSQ